MAPFLIFLVLVFRLLDRNPSRTIKISLLIAVSGLLIASNVYYQKYQDNIYFMRSLHITDAARTNILDHYTKEELLNRDIVIVMHGDGTLKNWVFYKNAFINLYVDRKHAPTIYVNDVSEIRDAVGPGSNPVIIDVEGISAKEIQFQSVE